jgi:hypothetical protein
MVNLRSTVAILQAQRRELIEQLDAVDRAIAALTSAADATETDEGKTAKAVNEAPGDLVARTVKPKRVLSEAHKQAIIAGRRKGRAAKEVAAGRAREMPEEGFVPAIAAGTGSDAPRLVKRQQERHQLNRD